MSDQHKINFELTKNKAIERRANNIIINKMFTILNSSFNIPTF